MKFHLVIKVLASLQYFKSIITFSPISTLKLTSLKLGEFKGLN